MSYNKYQVEINLYAAKNSDNEMYNEIQSYKDGRDKLE